MWQPYPSLHSPRDDEPTLGDLLAADNPSPARLSTDALRPPPPFTRPPVAVAKRAAKSAPREISSKRPVPLGRAACLGLDALPAHGKSVRNFDPRFEAHCGDLRDEHVERNYAFIDGLRARERARLTKEGGEAAANELRRMEEEGMRRERVERRRDVIREARKAEKEKVKRGKKPFYLKQGEVRDLEVKERWKRMGPGVRKFIEKRRKRIAGRDRKLLPSAKE